MLRLKPSEDRLKIGVFAGIGLCWPKISGTRDRSPPTILLVENYDDRYSMWYKM